jgi:hypothetical protein
MWFRKLLEREVFTQVTISNEPDFCGGDLNLFWLNHTMAADNHITQQ